MICTNLKCSEHKRQNLRLSLCQWILCAVLALKKSQKNIISFDWESGDPNERLGSSQGPSQLSSKPQNRDTSCSALIIHTDFCSKSEHNRLISGSPGCNSERFPKHAVFDRTRTEVYCWRCPPPFCSTIASMIA